MVKTFQRADLKKYGTMAKIIPVTNEVGKNIFSELIHNKKKFFPSK